MDPNFKQNKYKIIREAIPPNLADFIYNYFLLKRMTATTLINSRYLRSEQNEWGQWGDDQSPNTYGHYSDVAMETLLRGLRHKVEENTGLSLWETYSYARCYNKGDTLKRHKDRKACAVSCTLHLGGDKEWSIYLLSNNKEVKINLKKGDLLLYDGCALEHWRLPFTGKAYVQTFLHYVIQDLKNKHLKYDTRPQLGLPIHFKKGT